jgi:transcription termination factor Rho
MRESVNESSASEKSKIIKFNKSVRKENCFKKDKEDAKELGKESEETVVSDSTSTQEVVAHKKSKSKSIKQTDSNPSFKTKKSNFRDSDFEFDGIIESEGVLK